MIAPDFWTEDSAAVSSDFMILSSALIAMSLFLVGSLRDGTSGLSSNTSNALQAAEVTPLGTLGQSAP